MEYYKLLKEKQLGEIYTFAPNIIPNKQNEKYYKKLINSINLNNDIDYLNYQLANNNNNNSSSINKSSLIVVPEENNSNNNINDMNFISRLNEYEKIKKNNLEKIKNEIEQNNIIDIYNNYYTNPQKYFFEDNHLLNASNNFHQNKKKNIERIKKQIYDEQGITFSPKINNNYVIPKTKSENDFARKREKMFDYLLSKEKECTFQPKINNIIPSILNNNACDRLYGYQYKYQEKLDMIKNKYEENYSFHPEISSNTNIILNNRKKLIEGLKEKIKYNNPKEKIPEKIPEKCDEENNLNTQGENENNMDNNSGLNNDTQNELLESNENNENKENTEGNNYVTFNGDVNNINKGVNLKNSNNKHIMNFSYYNNFLNK